MSTKILVGSTNPPIEFCHVSPRSSEYQSTKISRVQNNFTFPHRGKVTFMYKLLQLPPKARAHIPCNQTGLKIIKKLTAARLMVPTLSTAQIAFSPSNKKFTTTVNHSCLYINISPSLSRSVIKRVSYLSLSLSLCVKSEKAERDLVYEFSLLFIYGIRSQKPQA